MKVQFYILNTTELSTVEQFSCKLTEKIFKKNHRLQIHVNDNQQIHSLDQQLWSYKMDQTYIPHLPQSEMTSNLSSIPIVLTDNRQYLMNQPDILLVINSDRIPDKQSFNQVLYIIDQKENHLRQARLLYKHYKTQQLPIQTHKI